VQACEKRDEGRFRILSEHKIGERARKRRVTNVAFSEEVVASEVVCQIYMGHSGEVRGVWMV